MIIWREIVNQHALFTVQTLSAIREKIPTFIDLPLITHLIASNLHFFSTAFSNLCQRHAKDIPLFMKTTDTVLQVEEEPGWRNSLLTKYSLVPSTTFAPALSAATNCSETLLSLPVVRPNKPISWWVGCSRPWAVFCNRWPCWTCQMQDERQTRTEASLHWGVKSRRANKGSN